MAKESCYTQDDDRFISNTKRAMGLGGGKWVEME